MRLEEIQKAEKEFQRRLFKPKNETKLELKEPEKVLQCIMDKLKVKIGFCVMTSTYAKKNVNRC